MRGELHGAGCPAAAADAGPAILALLLAHPAPLADKPPARGLLAAQAAGPALRVNTFEGVQWFDRECFELLADLLAVTAGSSAVAEAAAPEAPLKLRTERPPIAVTRAVAVVRRLREAAAASAWQWDDFRTAWLEAPEPKAPKPKARAVGKRPARRRSRRRKQHRESGRETAADEEAAGAPVRGPSRPLRRFPRSAIVSIVVDMRRQS